MSAPLCQEDSAKSWRELNRLQFMQCVCIARLVWSITDLIGHKLCFTLDRLRLVLPFGCWKAWQTLWERNSDGTNLLVANCAVVVNIDSHDRIPLFDPPLVALERDVCIPRGVHASFWVHRRRDFRVWVDPRHGVRAHLPNCLHILQILRGNNCHFHPTELHGC